MNDAQIASWLSADSVAWVSIVVPALIAFGVLVFVVMACTRHGHKSGREAPPATPQGPRRAPGSAGVVFFPR